MKALNHFLCVIFTLPGASVKALMENYSKLVGTSWKLTLDVGLQTGTWMPKRYPGWAESGARLGLDVEVTFREDRIKQREELLGDDAWLVAVSDSTPSTYVTVDGAQEATFRSGGWSIQRPNQPVKNSAGGTVQPEGILRFWLDCVSGAKRQDVEIQPDTRIFFTTGVWETTEKQVAELRTEYERICSEMEALVEDTKEKKNAGKNLLDDLVNFRGMVSNSKEFDDLERRRKRLELSMPPTKGAASENGAVLAPTGSLVIPGRPRWFGSEYLILGEFTAASSFC